MTMGRSILFCMLLHSAVGDSHGHGSAEEEKIFTQTEADLRQDSAVAYTFAAMLGIAVLLFYFANCSCRNRHDPTGNLGSSLKHLTWTFIGLVASIFIAVNLFYVELMIIEELHLSLHENPTLADLVALGTSLLVAEIWVASVIAFFYFQDLLATSGVIKNWRWYRVIIMPTTIKITAHIEGFALLHFLAFLQDLVAKLFCKADGADEHHRLLSASVGGLIGCDAWKKMDLWVVIFGGWCLGTIIATVLAQIHYRILKYVVTCGEVTSLNADYHPFGLEYNEDRGPLNGKYPPKEEDQHYESLDELWAEFSIESIALATSYCFVRVLLALVTNRFPGIYKVFEDRDKNDFWKWLLMTLLITLIAVLFFIRDVFYGKHTKKTEKEVEREVEEELEGEEGEEGWFKEYLGHFANMCAAWCWLTFIRWVSSSISESYFGYHVTPLLELLVAATATTFLSFFTICPLSAFRDKFTQILGTQPYASFHDVPIAPTVTKGVSDIIDVLALLTAFMWELVLENALHGAAKGAALKEFNDVDKAQKVEMSYFMWLAPIWGILLVPMYCCWAYPQAVSHGNHKVPVGLCPDGRGEMDCPLHCDCGPNEEDEEFEEVEEPLVQ